MELKPRIIEGAIAEFGEKGVRFTMDELSNRLGVSKRTIYEQIGNKEDILDLLITDAFSEIKKQETETLENPKQDLLSKLKTVLTLISKLNGVLDYRRRVEIRKFYPKLYAKIEEQRETGWDTAISLLETAIQKQLIKPVKPALFKEFINLTLSNSLQETFLLENNLTYDEVVKYLIDVIFNGIVIERKINYERTAEPE